MNPNPSPGPTDEQPSDEAIGQGIRYSIIAVILLLAAVLGAYLVLRPRQVRGPVKLTPLTAPKTAEPEARAIPPTATFTDVTAAAGITFRHENGAAGEKLLPETMGGGVAFFDFDNDGDPDLLFVNGSPWPWNAQGKVPPPGVVLYRNDSNPGAIRFTDVTSGSGLEAPFYGMGVATGDFDNDGAVDVLITGVGGARLFRNLGGGKFKDVTTVAGVGGDPGDWSTACAWFDMDNDGDLDLFVGSYVRWSRTIDSEVGYKLTGGARAYGPPMNFQGAFSRLYRNDGGGRFTDVSAAAGMQVRNPATGVPAAKTLGVAPVDLNGDGWMDLVVANDTVQNFVFENQRNGTFKEVGAVSGIGFDSYGNTRGAMGMDVARFTREGRLAVAIGNFANEMTAFYVAQANPMLFTDEAISWGIGGPSRDPLKFGVLFLDYDLDGRLDLLTVNGHLEEEIGKIQHGQRYEQAAQLFWNAGDPGFVLATTNHAGTDLFQPIVGRGSAVADVDGDGDPDVVFTALRGRPILLRNDQKLGRHWLRVKLSGTTSNRDAMGAWVRLVSGGLTQWRQVMSCRSYLSASETTVSFGLGAAVRFDELEVLWPSGSRTLLKPGESGRIQVTDLPRGGAGRDRALAAPLSDTLLRIDEPK